MPKVRTRFRPGPPRHFIKAWREHRGHTQEALAEMVGVTHGAISQLERGTTSYTQPMLEALADALACTPADLIMRNPLDENAPWAALEGLKPETRVKAMDIIKALKIADDRAA